MNSHVAIVGIGTEVGKTLISAIVCKAFNAPYWKPIQSGYLNGHGDRDSTWVQSMSDATFLPEAYLLQQPLSPHIAAELDGIVIEKSKLKIPHTEQSLVIETAGGLMVPINNDTLMIDILKDWNIPVILVVRQYLGNINHTLLSVEALKNKNIPILGWISNGNALPDTIRWIQEYTKLPLLLEIPNVNQITKDIVEKWAADLNLNMIKNGLEFKR